jgi:retinol dehydrogenase 12
MEQPICLITGATDGVGKATAHELAARGFTVVLAARDRARAKAVKAEILAATGGEIDILEADLTSLTAVRDLARRITEDGFETTIR